MLPFPAVSLAGSRAASPSTQVNPLRYRHRLVTCPAIAALTRIFFCQLGVDSCRLLQSVLHLIVDWVVFFVFLELSSKPFDNIVYVVSIAADTLPFEHEYDLSLAPAPQEQDKYGLIWFIQGINPSGQPFVERVVWVGVRPPVLEVSVELFAAFGQFVEAFLVWGAGVRVSAEEWVLGEVGVLSEEPVVGGFEYFVQLSLNMTGRHIFKDSAIIFTLDCFCCSSRLAYSERVVYIEGKRGTKAKGEDHGREQTTG